MQLKMLYENRNTYEYGFLADQAIDWLNIKLSTLCDLLALSFLLGIGLAILFCLVPNISNCFLSRYKSFFQTGILGFNLQYHFQVIFLQLDLMLDKECYLCALRFYESKHCQSKYQFEWNREFTHFQIYYVCKSNIDQQFCIFKIILKMKISLNQPNGFNTHFSQDQYKYLDAKSENIENARNRFNPYVNNGGTVVAIAGSDFVVVGGDSRLSQGYSIVTRSETKLVKLTQKTILATSGMYADFCELTKVLKAKLQIYDFKIERQPTTESIAHLLSKTLYGRRFFPYYTFNLVAGLDKDGKGVVYGYDAIGSYGSDRALAQGSGAHMIIPYLDAEVTGYNNPKHNQKPALTIEKAVEIVQIAFRSCAERDIYTGDKLEIQIISKQGVRTEWRQLRRD